MSSSWFEERRADRAADADERRKSKAFDAKLRREERREEKKEKRDDEAQRRRDRTARRQSRAARREKTLTPGNVYRKGTLVLVALSALASLPAQIIHFASIYWMLSPIGPALEGAAWVMAAGVAYADEKKLAPWVRWLLRALSMGAAGYAANINYGYGVGLQGSGGLSASEAAVVGWGLAAVTMLGPLFFEVRQWVLTLTADRIDPKKQTETKAAARHEKKRRKHHKDVAKLARRLMSAAPFGTLAFEEAFAAAWEIKYGTRTLGMTPVLYAEKLASSKALGAAMDEANGSPVSSRGRLLELLHPAPQGLLSRPGSSQVASLIPPPLEKPSSGKPEKPEKGSRKKPVPPLRRKGDTAPYHPAAKVAAADTARKQLVVNGHHH